jgi:ribosome modulation factor
MWILSEDLQEARDAGWTAFYDFKEQDDNPYRPDDQRCNCWLEGWELAAFDYYSKLKFNLVYCSQNGVGNPPTSIALTAPSGKLNYSN